jgi:Zn-dependent M28 family amino/carboxypeptidase
LYLNPEKADLFFQGTNKTYKALLDQSHTKNFKPFVLKTMVAFDAVIKQREFKSDNLIAGLEGRDTVLKNKYVLIGAHYDHLGIGEQMDGDSVYNGVMDNAVGCAVTLELARMFCRTEFRPKRSIIFAFFTGEEKGLLGSEYFISHPSIDPDNIAAMINIDGLSAMGRFQSLIAVGGRYSDLGPILQNVTQEYGLETESVNIAAYDMPFTKSDQLSFALGGIPALQVLEGYSYPDISKSEAILKTQSWFENYYHSPADDLKQKIDIDSIKRYTDFMYLFINRILNQTNDPQWFNDSPYQRK